MRKLISGVQTFQKQAFPSKREHFEKLGEGQAPHTLFITCSDSRISPSLLTQSEPGELFIIRNAGNIVPSYAEGSGEAAAVEFAVAGLGVADVVVCGHSHCGAMKGLLDPASLDELPAMKQWLRHAQSTHRLVKDHYKSPNGEGLLNIAIQENVLAQLANLRSHPAVHSRLAVGTLRLHGWVYKIESGEVFALDETKRQFAPVADVKVPAFAARALDMLP